MRLSLACLTLLGLTACAAETQFMTVNDFADREARFLDAEAAPGVRYEYTIQAITEVGLTSHSGTIASRRN